MPYRCAALSRYRRQWKSYVKNVGITHKTRASVMRAYQTGDSSSANPEISFRNPSVVALCDLSFMFYSWCQKHDASLQSHISAVILGRCIAKIVPPITLNLTSTVSADWWSTSLPLNFAYLDKTGRREIVVALRQTASLRWHELMLVNIRTLFRNTLPVNHCRRKVALQGHLPEVAIFQGASNMRQNPSTAISRDDAWSWFVDFASCG